MGRSDHPSEARLLNVRGVELSLRVVKSRSRTSQESVTRCAQVGYQESSRCGSVSMHMLDHAFSSAVNNRKSTQNNIKEFYRCQTTNHELRVASSGLLSFSTVNRPQTWRRGNPCWQLLAA